MFRIRIITPAVTNEDGWAHAGGLLVVGGTRLAFLVDLTHWSSGDYERQWRAGIRRIVEGAPSAALLTAYRGPGGAPHVIWALWRDDVHVHVQEQTLLPAELDAPLDPRAPHAHVGPRVQASELGLPIAEWRIELVPFLAAALGIRLPAYSF